MVVVLNGEIYNYRELRDGCSGRGHRFAHRGRHRGHRPPVRGARRRTASSIAATACSPSRSGTTRRRRLLLARDRVGKKPLFYAARGGTLSFASEMTCAPAGPRRSRATSTARRSTATCLPVRARAAERVRGACASSRRPHGWCWRTASLSLRALLAARLRPQARLRDRPRSSARRIREEPASRRRACGCDRRRAARARSCRAGRLLGAWSPRWPRPLASRCGPSRSASTPRRFNELRARARRSRELFGTEHHEFVRRARRHGAAAERSCATTASRSPTPRRSRASTWPS